MPAVMSAVAPSEIKLRIKQILVDRLKLDRAPESIGDAEPLFGPEGLGLDSIDALELVLGVEQEFGVKIENEEVGSEARLAAGPRPSRDRRREALVETLDERGYEPAEVGSTLRLRNCPFHALVDDHRDLVCGMNLALAEGILDGLGEERISARLDRQPGLCCVAFDLE